MLTVRDGASQAFLMHSTVPIYLKLYERLHYVDNVTAGFNMVSHTEQVVRFDIINLKFKICLFL